MIIAKAEKGNKRWLLIGIEPDTLETLKQHKLIDVTREKHGEGVPENLTIVLAYGEPQELLAHLKKTGFIDKNTKTNIPDK